MMKASWLGGNVGSFAGFKKLALALFAGLALVLDGQAGLEVQKAINGDLTQVESGQQFSYVLRYRAASTTTDFIGAYLSDTIPPELEYISSVGTPHTDSITYNAGTRELRVQFIDPLPAGSTGEIAVNVRFPPGTTTNGTVAINSAMAAAANSAPVSSAPVSITAVASDKAYADKSLVGGSLPLDQDVTFSVALRNPTGQGALNITNVTMTDVLPTGAVFVAASGGGVYDAVNGLVVWSMPNVPAGSSASRFVTLRFPAPPFTLGTHVENTVLISGTAIGQAPTNYQHAVTNVVAPPTASVNFNKGVDGNFVYEGKPINKPYNFTLQNTGNTPLNNVAMEDTIPNDLNVTRINTGNFSGTPDGMGGTINLFYQTTTSGGWVAAAGNPYDGAANTGINVSSLGLAPGDYVTALRWEFGTLPVNYRINNLSFQADVLTVDRAGNPVLTDHVVSNTGTLTYVDFNGPKTNNKTASLTVKSDRPVADVQKSMLNSNPVNDGDTLTFRVVLNNLALAAQPLENPVLADLLDPYLTYVDGSAIVQAAPPGAPVPTLDIATNYNSTGKTLLRWSWPGFAMPINSSIEVRFQAKLTPGTLYGAHGNQASLVGWGNTNIDNYYGTSPTTDTNDLSGAGTTNTTVFSRTFNYTINGVAAMDSVKWVKGQLDTDWSKYPASGNTVPGGLADYKLVVKNIGNVPMSHVQFVDILPFVGDTGVIDLSGRDSTWRPNLAGPVTVPAGVTVYYSTAGNPTRTDYVPNGPPGSTNADWSTTPPANITEVRAIKLDFGNLVLQPNQELEMIWPMRAPVGAPENGEICWNSFGYYGIRTDANTPLLASEPIKVGIKILADTNAVYGDYVWFDQDRNGIQSTNEPGINGIKVWFYQDSGPGGVPDGVRDPATDLSLGFTITGDDYSGKPGYYLFPNLDRGDYYAVFQVPPGFTVSTNNLGGDATLDSDVSSVTVGGTNLWMTPITHLDQAEHDLTWDMGLWTEAYGVQLIKTANNAPDGTVLWKLLNQPVTYYYRVTNTGALDLVTLRVTDDKLGYIGTIPRLAAGETAILTNAPVSVVVDTTNIGTVIGHPAAPGGGPELPGLPPATSSDDAVVKLLAQLGDRVWYDYNGDGKQDNSENTGIANVRVFLRDAGGQPVATNRTDASGYYQFTVQPGTYEVQFDLSTLATNLAVSPYKAAGVNAAKDSNANPATGRTGPITLVAGQSDWTWDMGVWAPSSIGDTVWYDLNHNGQEGEPLEIGVAGITVYLQDSLGHNVATNVTDVFGHYLFDNLRPGTYIVQFDVATIPFGYVSTVHSGVLMDPFNSDGDPLTGLTTPIPLPADTHYDQVDFGIWTDGQVGDRVWFDENCNGVQDMGEPGVTNITVYLSRGGTPVASTVTDSTGHYLFSNLPPGNYSVTFDLATIPYGYKVTTRGPLGAKDASDSDADTTTGACESFALSPGEHDLSWDMGLVHYRSGLNLTKRALPVTTYPSTWTIPISKGEQFVDGDYWLRLEYGQPSFDVWGPGNLKSGVTIDEKWHHVVGRFTRGTNTFGPHLSEIMVDGVVVATRNSPGTTKTSTAPLMLGAYLGNTGFYAGLMDEVRLSHVARSDAWLRTTYAQQQNPATFLSFGAEEASSVPGYAHRRLLTINGALVAGPLTNFPVLVSTIQDSLRTGVTSASGADIVFSSTGGALLAHEIELFRQPAGRLVSWVRLPVLAAGTSTQFYINYGNPAAGAPPYPPTAVWDSGFSMVQHLEEVSGSVLDSTINANTGLVHGAHANVYGSADGAFEFNGVNQYIEVPNNPTVQLNTTDFTVEGWFCRKSVNADALFEVAITNAGPDTALNLSIGDQLAPNFSLVQPEASRGIYDAATGLWQIGDLAVGGSATLQLAVNLNGAAPLTNTAEVAGCDSIDPNLLHGVHYAGDGLLATAIVGGSGGGTPITNGSPDFVINSLSTTPASLTAGCAFTATVAVANNGPVAGNAGKLRLWLNKASTAVVGEAGDATLTLGTLAAGASTNVVFTGLTAGAMAGTYNLRAFVDADGGATEQSEGNNQKTLTYTISSSGGGGSSDKPDFSVTALSTTPATLTKGCAFSATITVKNQGAATGNAGVLRLWVNHFATANAGEAGDRAQNLGSLAAGASTTITISGLTAPNAAGTYTLRAFADANNATVEQSEGNNQKTLTYGFSDTSSSGGGGGSGGSGGSGSGAVEKPDFVVSDISFSPTTLTKGGNFTAYVTVVNNGPVAGDAGYLDIYIDRVALAPAGTVGDANQALGTMAAGESRILTFTGLIAPNAVGTHTFRTFIDSRGLTAEQSEGNNQKTRTYGFY